MTLPIVSDRPWTRRAEGVTVVGFWLLLGILTAVRESTRRWPGEEMDWGEIVETFAEIGLWALITPLVFWLARRYPAERGAWAARLAGQLVVGLAIAVAVEYVTRGVLRPILSAPIQPGREWTLAGTFNRLRFLDEFIVYLAVLTAGYARSAFFQVQERRAEAERLIADRARLEADLAQARLSALQMQLHPHFLFNTLNAVSALVERDPAGVRTLIARLSSLLRRVLEADGAQAVPLREEVSFLRDYLDVQQVRFQGRLEVEEDIEDGTLDALVPPLILQPLVENAVGHGVSRLEEGVGVIRLVARRDGDRLVLRIEDNGPGLTGAAPTSTGVGLANTRERLEALYGDAAALSLRPGLEAGAEAEIDLPWTTADDG
ncbi:sensor histidine kinase [Rubrivirga sp.]|uniref:sensor histidine kinase n=1 Tax=Rubrivirga sp. TaxID=1885344 RepID=UPI003C75AA03